MLVKRFGRHLSIRLIKAVGFKDSVPAKALALGLRHDHATRFTGKGYELYAVKNAVRYGRYRFLVCEFLCQIRQACFAKIFQKS